MIGSKKGRDTLLFPSIWKGGFALSLVTLLSLSQISLTAGIQTRDFATSTAIVLTTATGGSTLQDNKAIAVSTMDKDHDAYAKEGVLAMVKDNKGWGLVGVDGEILLAPTYKTIEPTGDGSFWVGKKGEKSVAHVDKTGTDVTVATPTLSEAQKQGQRIFFKDDKTKRFGLANGEGKTIIAPTYKAVLADFSEGIAFVTTEKNKKIAIDEEGKELFTIPYSDISPYQDGLAEYRRPVHSLGIGIIGVLIGGGGGYNHPYRGIDVGTYDGVKRGYIDRSGHIVIDSKLDKVYPVTAYGSVVEDQGDVGFINRQGAYVIPLGNYTYKGLVTGGAGYIILLDRKALHTGVMNLTDGSVTIPFLYDDVTFLSSQIVALQTPADIRISQIEPRAVLFTLSKEATYTDFRRSDYLWVKKDTKVDPFVGYKIVDKKGEVVFKDTQNEIQDVKSFFYDAAPAKKNGKWGVITIDGKWIVEPTYETIEML